MKVIWRPLVERFSASSDFDEKLVTSWLDGTGRVETSRPAGVYWSSTIGAATPKLESTMSLLNTYGYAPSAVAVAHPVVQPGGSTVTPGWISASRYWLVDTSRLPGARRAEPKTGLRLRRSRGERGHRQPLHTPPDRAMPPADPSVTAYQTSSS